jgi:DivIVA domain-containing protein
MTEHGEFRVVLRGYDRVQVDEFMGEVADRIDALEKERAAIVARLGEGGRSDPDSEIDAVTSEINRILHAANEAAEGMRSRASRDAAMWRSEAEEESSRVRGEAQESAEATRGDAWAAATELLEQVKAHIARMTQEAEQDILNMRAEAEHGAARHVTQARQEAEETIRHSRLEADRMMEQARQESRDLVEASNLEAEAAQERARALEERRAELMAELDVAQGAISKLEADLAARKEALAAVGSLDTSTVRVVVEEPEADEWFDDDETVRLVSARGRPARVDAQELADEVRELRERREQAESAVARLLAEVDGGEIPSAAPEPSPSPEPAPPEAPPVPEPAPPEAPPVPEPAQPPPVPEPPPPETSPGRAEAAVPPVPVDVDGLFAALRGTGDAAEGATASPVAVATTPEVDPFELRDRLLLPMTNRTLRAVKKALVELQNETLEEVREAGEEWRPDRTAFEAAFRADLEELAKEAHAAGFGAAAELAGADPGPQPDSAPTDPTTEVAGSLFAEVDAVTRRALGGGTRQSSAAVSRVFRTWRTDSAERHVRAASLASYHDGLLWGLEALGVESVRGVADGRMCAECPASVKTPWPPTGSTPKGTGIPPVHLDCGCTIVPV